MKKPILSVVALAPLCFVTLFPVAGRAWSAAPEAPEAPEVSLQDFAWLAGTWRQEQDGSFLEETWSTPVGDSIVAMFRWVGKGKTSLFELMSIEQDAQGAPVFRIRHFHPGLRPWASERDAISVYPLVDLGETRAVFENPEAGGGRRFVYERDGDTLNVRAETADDEVFEFAFERAR